MRGEADDVEGADQIDLHRTAEIAERMRAVLANHAFARRDACAVDDTVNTAKCGDAHVDGGLHTGFIGHIGFNEAGLWPQFSLLGDAGFFIDVSKDDAGTIFDEHLGGCGTET